MPKFVIHDEVTTINVYEIEAETEEQALENFLDGDLKDTWCSDYKTTVKEIEEDA